ncbi:PH (Pleckstrin Homology) domain-containing protein [Kineococcus rhizosphaerae]|uniref:PH (Pleckstrin Homology) domain-containing protein n=2 Tax=Kineococcus rhizosphaerae TaxID=559628 RepID=A0A2T0R5Q2_9ACTN|nr:PH (Pleckstrin Homology) domain-containing protein [Kineococcus rhizosphaerae]
MFSGTRLRKSRSDGTWRVVDPERDQAAPGPDDESDPLEKLVVEEVEEVEEVDEVVVDDPLWEQPPPRVERYVLDTEKRLVCLRRHLVVLAEPFLTCIAGLVLVNYLADRLGDVQQLPNVLFGAWLVLLGRAWWKWQQWRGDWFIATDKRLLLTYGVVRRQVAMMPLTKVTDMSYNRSLPGRFLGYGELVMESAGQDQALSNIDRLPMPDQVYVRICEQLFGEVGGADTSRRMGARVRRMARRALPQRFR